MTAPSYWSSGLPRPEHMLPDPGYPDRTETEADERDRGLEMLGRGRRRRRPEPLPEDDA